MNPIVLHLFQGTLVENHPYLENRWSTRKKPPALILGYVPTRCFNLSSRKSWEHLQNCENVSWKKEYLTRYLTSPYISLSYRLATTFATKYRQIIVIYHLCMTTYTYFDPEWCWKYQSLSSWSRNKWSLRLKHSRYSWNIAPYHSWRLKWGSRRLPGLIYRSTGVFGKLQRRRV